MSYNVFVRLGNNFCYVSIPSIAQLVERRTVEIKLSSLGRWFESGSKEYFFLYFNREKKFRKLALYPQF